MTSRRRKRIGVSDLSIPKKKQRRRDEGEEGSRLEALPQEILIKILSGIDGKDFKQVFHVSRTIREATVIARADVAIRNPFVSLSVDTADIAMADVPIRNPNSRRRRHIPMATIVGDMPCLDPITLEARLMSKSRARARYWEKRQRKKANAAATEVKKTKEKEEKKTKEEEEEEEKKKEEKQKKEEKKKEKEKKKKEKENAERKLYFRKQYERLNNGMAWGMQGGG